MTLSEAVTARCRDVSGIDRTGEAVQAHLEAVLAANRPARLRAARVADADGAARRGAGRGAPAHRCLADRHARGDRCARVDRRARIPATCFAGTAGPIAPARALQELHRLVLPAIAALTRDRELLVRPCGDRGLVGRARA